MKKVNYTIVFVTDMKRSVEFYHDVLGFPVKFESPGWTEFATEGSILALHPGAGGAASEAVGEKTRAGTCQPGFLVPDLEAFHQQVVAKGAKCLQPPTVQDFGGKLGVYADPDGLPFSVGEEGELGGAS